MHRSLKTFLARSLAAAAALSFAALPGPAVAALAAPTEAEAKAAAEKKAKADAKAATEKKQLAASMEAVAQRWRTTATERGWTVHSPTPIDAVAGISAEAALDKPSGQPGGKLGEDAAKAPVRSEKLGTAPDSQDVKPAAKPEGAK